MDDDGNVTAVNITGLNTTQPTMPPTTPPTPLTSVNVSDDGNGNDDDLSSGTDDTVGSGGNPAPSFQPTSFPTLLSSLQESGVQVTGSLGAAVTLGLIEIADAAFLGFGL